MTAFFNLDIESIIQDGFYVPIFEVKIAGVGLPRDVLRDVIEITYRDNVQELDTFEVKVNNWDATLNAFKYVGAETAGSITPGHDQFNELHTLFDPCNKSVEIVMGYLGDTRVMMKGNFTTMEPVFPNSGGPTLNVRGVNILHELRRKKLTKTWSNKKPSDAVKSLESDLPVGIAVDLAAKAQEEQREFFAMRNQYPIDFILAQARELDYVAVLQESGEGRELYFGPSQTGISGWTDFSFELKWGQSLIDFQPTLTTANQVKSVTVRGFQRSNGQVIEETVDIHDARLNRNQDLYELLEKCDPRETIEVDEPVFTRREARERAIRILRDRQRQMVKASGTTIGLADLRAGKKLRILGVGSRFQGTYFVTETTHVINDSGYITKFKARREEEAAQS